MATINYLILNKKKDGTYSIKYMLIHNREKKYFSSRFFVVDNQVTKKKKKDQKDKFEITLRDPKVIDNVNADLKIYREKIENIGASIKYMSAEDVKAEITKIKRTESIDFIEFCRDYLSGLKEGGKTGTYRSMNPPFNHLCDFSPILNANDVDSAFLKAFEAYLRKDKALIRSNAEKSNHVVKSALNDAGVFKVMQGIRNLHNKCKEKYNSENNIVITTDPFKFYKMPKYKIIRKDMDKDLVHKIQEYVRQELTGRALLARDIFMLSFYLCGMNAKDMYAGEYKIIEGRIEYERAKTAERRDDNAFISVYIPNEAKELLEKYNPQYLQKRYSAHENFIHALGAGHKGSGFTFYEARHSFASIAVNICGFSFDKVERALNHFDETRTINRYAARDWSIIDEVQEAVIKYINEDL